MKFNEKLLDEILQEAIFQQKVNQAYANRIVWLENVNRERHGLNALTPKEYKNHVTQKDILECMIALENEKYTGYKESVLYIKYKEEFNQLIEIIKQKIK